MLANRGMSCLTQSHTPIALGRFCMHLPALLLLFQDTSSTQRVETIVLITAWAFAQRCGLSALVGVSHVMGIWTKIWPLRSCGCFHWWSTSIPAFPVIYQHTLQGGLRLLLLGVPVSPEYLIVSIYCYQYSVSKHRMSCRINMTNGIQHTSTDAHPRSVSKPDARCSPQGPSRAAS